jgi:uncharacterized protein DUF2442
MRRTERDVRGARVHLDAETAQVVVALANGASFRVPVNVFPDVAEASEADRAAVRLSSDGDGLRWDALDVDYYWPYLMAVLLGEDAWRRAATKGFASLTSPAKARASRANGAKGGRPRKRTTTAKRAS